MMTEAEQTLWNKIGSFDLDDDNSSFTFTTRLARENGWNAAYAIRVVEEYKKFIFLCCVSPGGVTPSDPVDQAWHLHLTYTRSYWIDFCQNTLGQDIHHTPTKGGTDEAVKFDGYYTLSFKLYEDKFNIQPPADIWHDNEKRFSDIDFQRVNMKEFRAVKHSAIRKIKFVAFILLCIAACFITIPYVIENFEVLKTPLFLGGVFLILGIAAYNDFNSKKPNGQNKSSDGGCGGGDSCSSDSDSGHGGHGHGDGGHGCSSGCSGCSGSGCSGWWRMRRRLD